MMMLEKLIISILKGTLADHLLSLLLRKQHNYYIIFSLFYRVEKKERARLKTVKFHARTGMIESNRVSVNEKHLTHSLSIRSSCVNYMLDDPDPGYAE